jgi:DNA-binding CsgD family transcriptional regulator
MAGIVMLSNERTTIGRATEADVTLASDPTTSRLHSAVERYSGGFVLRDLGSTNGTFLNGERLVGDRPLQPGDEIRVGASVFIFRAVEEGDPAGATVRGEAPPRVTKREREVLVELCRPLIDQSVAFGRPATVAEIATCLYIGQATVKFHLDNLYDKFGLLEPGDGRRLSLANEALRRGAVTLSELRHTDGAS